MQGLSRRQHQPERARDGLGESVSLADGALDGDGAAVRRPLHRPVHAAVGAGQRRRPSLSTWDRMGYDPASDNGAEQWRDVYWSLGQNLVDMINKAEAEQRWDIAGVGYFMKAWGWQVLTDMHGEIIVKEAIDPDAQHVRLRHAGVRVHGSPAAARPGDHGSPEDRRRRRRDVPRKDGPHLQRRSHEVAEARLRSSGHQPQPLHEQVDVQAGRRDRRGRQVVREQRRRRAARIPGHEPGRSRDFNFWGRSRNNITQLSADAVRRESDERHRFRRRSIRA